ncbi:MAG: DoxX family protein [Gammaproteobacteria bacterium]|nr:DoxX family protein [Gammaproteobacteria bacterium]
MKQINLNDVAVFLLRISLGIVLIAHSLYLKIFVFTMDGTTGFFVSLGLPAWLAYVVLAMEAVTGIMLILGIQARWAAIVIVPVLLGATWAHLGNGWMFAYEGGGWEYPLYLSLLAVVQFLLGDGAFAMVKSKALATSA